MKLLRALFTTATISLVCSSISAQSGMPQPDNVLPTSTKCESATGKFALSGTVGTTGVGFELSTRFNSYLRLRAGFTYMPKFDVNMNFKVEGYDSNGEKIDDAKFEKLSNMMENLTGIKVDNNITMTGRPNFYNGKLLLDIFPLKNKHWHITAGFYYGSSSIGRAENTTADMPSLLAIKIYNQMYEKALDDEPVISVGSFDIYRPDLVDYGRMGVHVGDYPSDDPDKNNPYIMEPDENSMVSAKLKVNKFKPYVGMGFENQFKMNKRWGYGIEAGALMWGGMPKVIAHDGTDLTRDVTNISGKVGNYVNFVKKLKAYPVLNFRIAYNIL